MAETTVSDLKVRLEGIRDERSTHANTAYRIGSAMLELLSYAEAVAGSVDLSGLERAISLKVNLANLTELLTPLDSQKNPISWNEATLSNTAYLRANVDFFSTGGVSALGLGISGGGGGVSLGGLLNAMNNLDVPSDGAYSLTINNGTVSLTAAGGGVSLGGLLTAMNNLGVPSNGSYSLTINNGTVSLTAAGGGSSDLTLAQVWTSLRGNSDAYASAKINAAHIPDLSGIYQTVIGDLATIRSNAAYGLAAYSLQNSATWWGQPINGEGVVSGDIAMNIGEIIKFGGLNTFEVDAYAVAVGYGYRTQKPLDLYGRTIRFYPNGGNVANITSDGVIVGTSDTDENHYLKIGGCRLCWDNTNNALYVVHADGTSAVNFYATGGVSALGAGVDGEGGGANLNSLLDSINSSSIGDDAPTSGEVGKCLVYLGNNSWGWVTPGGGNGTVTRISTGTGLTGGPITSTGTISINSTYQTYISHGETAYGWGNHAAQGYLTSETYRGTVTSVAMTVPTGLKVSGSPITSNGTFALSLADGYSIPTTAKQTAWDNKQNAISDLASIRTNASHGQTAYGWGNHADQGYLPRSEGMRFTSYGTYIAARLVDANGVYDSERSALAQGDGYIEWWSTGGFFNHWMGNVKIGQDANDTTHYIQIGGGRIYWDSTNNALYVQKADGTACHFYSLGGVSALGMGVSGSAGLNTLTLNSLSVNGQANIDTLVVTNEIDTLDVSTLNIINELWLNGNSIYMDGGNIADAYEVQTTTLRVGSGASTIKKIYWDGTYLQVVIGTKTYKFRPDATS